MVYGVLRDKEFTFDVILSIWHHHDLKPLLSEIQDGRHCLFEYNFHYLGWLCFFINGFWSWSNKSFHIVCQCKALTLYPEVKIQNGRHRQNFFFFYFFFFFLLFGLKWCSVRWFLVFCGSMKSHSMSIWWYDIFWPWIFIIRNPRWPPVTFLHIIFTSWVIWSTSVTMESKGRFVLLNQTFSGGDPRESMGGICESPK